MPFEEEDENALENELNKGALWAITYGDLMSYLMLFFLIMFSFTFSEQGMAFFESLSEVQKTFGGEENKELMDKKKAAVKEEDLAKEIQEKFSKNKDIDEFAQVELTEEKIKITLRDSILFASGEVDLGDNAKSVLHEVAEFARPMENKIVIEGHTDDTPVSASSKFISNWVLSMARAYKVLIYFNEDEDLPANRLACVGYGEHQPVASNETPEGRASNRRIEITLVRVQ
ncbi:flagellar motor protein MotB [Elusimicrobiota bacterium]